MAELRGILNYILISQDSARIETFSRRDDNTWLYAEFHGLDSVINIEPIGCSLRLGDVYHKVELLAPLG